MLLRTLLSSTPVVRSTGSLDRPVSDVTRDTRALSPGGVFVAIRGGRVDGHDLIGDLAHAAALIVERPVAAPPGVTVIEVPDTRLALATLSAAFRGDPGRAIKVVGVTGTNGKTTTTTLVEQALRGLGRKAGRIGTTGIVVDGRDRPASLTTPEAPDIQAILAEARDAGCEAVAMEVSSIGLDQRRVDAIPYHVAVFTNLTRDHLDHHGTMEAYAAAKRRLFTDLLRPITPSASGGGWPRALMCADDPSWSTMGAPSDRWTYGFSTSDVQIEAARPFDGGTALTLRTPVGRIEATTPLVGRYNAQNYAAALGVLLTLDVPLDDAARGLAPLRGAPGRLEVVENPGGALLLVDYAHSPDALESVLRTARALTTRTLSVVFGCGGDRDPGKRPQMGAIAERLADRVFVTADNPRSEDIDTINAQILAGMSSPPHVDADRARAIRTAVEDSGPGDVIVVAGKGHETYQEIRGVKHPFDDREVLRAAVRGDHGPTNNSTEPPESDR
jgi:UDP-N-acetylmuramoyl-L-alanyl-D-glutamate--2,6-diaminopimelate ligase